MLQDISPHVYDNAYHPRPPRKGDMVLVYGEEAAHLKQGADGNLTIPTYGEMVELAAGMKVEYVYLFSIDEIAFFLFFTFQPLKKLGLVKKPVQFFREYQPAWLGFAAITGYQLSKWYHEHKFCGKCGSKTGRSNTERAIVCPVCGTIVYPKLSPAVIVGILDGDRMLLTRYAGRPGRNYALVAGFVEIGETLEEAVRREVLEEVGVRVKNIRYFDSQPWSFSDSLLMGFYADLDGDDTITLDTSELGEAVWLHRADIPAVNSTMSLTATLIENFRTGGKA